MKRVWILLAMLALACGCSTLPEATKPAAQGLSPSDQPVYVVSHGWHTGIVFPRERLLEFVPALENRFPAGEFLEIGWGDKGFYQANEITSGITLEALFWPTETVVHVVAVPRSAQESFPNSETRLICLDQAQVESLARYLASSFSQDQADRILPAKEGIYGDSQFYVGVGSFHLFNTCNKWTAKGLESAGFDIDPTLKLTASSILAYLDTNQLPGGAQASDTVSASPAQCR